MVRRVIRRDDRERQKWPYADRPLSGETPANPTSVQQSGIDPFRPIAIINRLADISPNEYYGDIVKLTPRQKEILRLLSNGFDAKSAGRELDISVHTVNEHLREARRPPRSIEQPRSRSHPKTS